MKYSKCKTKDCVTLTLTGRLDTTSAWKVVSDIECKLAECGEVEQLVCDVAGIELYIKLGATYDVSFGKALR